MIPQIQRGVTVRGGSERHITIKEMFLNFPLWTFHLYVASFQQHLNM